jgi:hypothetical protein
MALEPPEFVAANEYRQTVKPPLVIFKCGIFSNPDPSRITASRIASQCRWIKKGPRQEPLNKTVAFGNP